MPDSFTCLAIETATEHCSVALAANGRRQIRHLTSSKESSREIYAVIAEILDAAGLAVRDLDCIAFGCGPGSFTGLRIAAGVAQGLAYSQALPVCRVSTLAALALAAVREHDAQRIAACLDARMGEVYLGLYQRAADGLPVSHRDDALLAPDAVDLDNADWLAVGSGWTAYPEMHARLAERISGCMSEVWPDADAVLTLAEHAYMRGDVVMPAGAIPNYLRNKVTD